MIHSVPTDIQLKDISFSSVICGGRVPSIPPTNMTPTTATTAHLHRRVRGRLYYVRPPLPSHPTLPCTTTRTSAYDHHAAFVHDHVPVARKLPHISGSLIAPMSPNPFDACSPTRYRTYI